MLSERGQTVFDRLVKEYITENECDKKISLAEQTDIRKELKLPIDLQNDFWTKFPIDTPRSDWKEIKQDNPNTHIFYAISVDDIKFFKFTENQYAKSVGKPYIYAVYGNTNIDILVNAESVKDVKSNIEFFEQGREEAIRRGYLTKQGQISFDTVLLAGLEGYSDFGKLIDDMNTIKYDFTKEAQEAHQALLSSPDAIAHFTNRGIDMDMIHKYQLGYAKDGYNQMVKSYPDNTCKGHKAILYKWVFPYKGLDGNVSYFLTEIDDRSKIDEYNNKYRKISRNDTGIEAQLFNEIYITGNVPDVVFICEGIYDALSVESVGGNAIALCGVGQNRFLNLCEKYRPNTSFVVSLDNDKAGKTAIERIKTGLDRLNIPYIVRTAEIGKDFNDAYIENKDQFASFIESAKNDAIHEAASARYLYSSDIIRDNVLDCFSYSYMNPTIEQCYITENQLADMLKGVGISQDKVRLKPTVERE